MLFYNWLPTSNLATEFSLLQDSW